MEAAIQTALYFIGSPKIRASASGRSNLNGTIKRRMPYEMGRY